MATRTFISALVVFHGHSTVLESGDDYYADVSDVTTDNAKKEEVIGLKIYQKYVKGQKATSGCTSLKAWLMQYAQDTNKWENHDAGTFKEVLPQNVTCGVSKEKNREWTNYNPEFERDKCLSADEQVLALNEAAVLLRSAIKQIADKPNPDCEALWHLMLCPVSGMRVLSPYEFAFKSNQSWTIEKGIEVNDATKAYNKAKCGNELTPCHKEVEQSKLTLLFQHSKGRGPKKKDWKPNFVNHGGLYEGKFNNSDLKDFWIKENQKIFLSQADCDKLIGAFCTNTELDKTFTFADEQMYDCAQLKLVCPELVLNKTHGTPTSPHQVATAETNKTTYDNVVKKFLACGVPWVGGVSGSALEQFAYALWKNVKIDDAFVLQWMSLYVLSGFHSMGEVWAALKPMLEHAKKLPIGMKDVPVPFGLDGTCTTSNETTFLVALEKLVAK